MSKTQKIFIAICLLGYMNIVFTGDLIYQYNTAIVWNFWHFISNPFVACWFHLMALIYGNNTMLHGFGLVVWLLAVGLFFYGGYKLYKRLDRDWKRQEQQKAWKTQKKALETEKSTLETSLQAANQALADTITAKDQIITDQSATYNKLFQAYQTLQSDKAGFE